MSRTKTQSLLWLIVFLALSATAAAQEYITGKVTSDDGKPIANVTCKLLNGNDSLLAYTFTKPNGVYSISRHKEATHIQFSLLGYEKKDVKTEDIKGRLDITLPRAALELGEVTVTADPIRRSKDTLFYQVDAFRQKGDHYIEDVIRRLPGIEVDGSGRITYQGKDINKLDIEGQDLMGYQYNQATQNMPADAVAQIQVMENNQPVRALEGKVPNDKATLNIKLKKDYRMRPFGEVEGGIGFKPTIWDNRLTTINISPKNQLLLTGAMNNHGISLAPLANDMLGIGDMYTSEPLPSAFLYSPTLNTPPISRLYYLDNKSHYVALNYLHAFSQYANLRVNMTYLHEGTVHRDSTFNQYISEDTVTIFENNRMHSKTDLLKGRVRYELNKKDVYLQDEVAGNISVTKGENGNFTNLGEARERTRRRPFLLQNTMSMTLNTADRLYMLSSIVRAYGSKERLNAGFDKELGSKNQILQLRNWFVRNRIGTSFNLFSHTLTLGYIMEYKKNNVGIEELDGGKRKSSYWLHVIEPSYSIGLSRAEIEMMAPLEYISYKYSWRDNVNHRLMFSPSVNIDYKLANMMTTDISLGYNQDANTTDVLYNALISHNYRTYEMYADSLSIDRAAVASMRLGYLNTASMLSWNIYVGYSHVKRDYYNSCLYVADLTLITPEWKDNSRTSWSAALSTRKIFRKAGLSVDYKVSYSYNKAFASQNGTEDYLRYNALSTSLSINWDKLSWLHIDITGAGNISWKAHDEFSPTSNVLRNVYYSVQTNFFPTKKLQAYCDFSQTTFEITHGSYSTNCFLNAGAQYEILHNLSIKFSFVNLLNRKKYELARYSGANYTYLTTPLRGRERTVSIGLKF